MVNPRLENYIRSQLNAGHDIDSIKQYLVKYGYQAADVEEAVDTVYGRQVKHVIHFSSTTLVAIAALFVVVVAAGLGIFALMSGGSPNQLLDVNIEPITTTVAAGEDAVFLTELTNFGSSKRYDIFLKYEVIDSATSAVITSKQETRGIETIGSKQTRLEIPSSTKPGNYLLRALATYNDQRAFATLPIIVTESAEEVVLPDPDPVFEDPVEEQPIDIEDPIIEDEPIDDGFVPADPSEDDSSLTTFETIEKVEVLAKQNRRQAEELCNGLDLQTSKDLCNNKLGEVLGDKSYCKRIVDERTSDVCYNNVAKIVNQNSICDEISKESRRDSCYMNFVIENKDYAVCDKVVNQYLKQSCESLRQLSDLNITDVAFYESVLNQSLIEFV